MLRNSMDQAFFGAAMVPFLTLDQDFVNWICEHIDLQCQLDPRKAVQRFKDSGFRNEWLGSAEYNDHVPRGFALAVASATKGSSGQ